MLNNLSRRGALAAALASFMVTEFQLRADDKQAEKLDLKSGYSGKVLIDGTRQVILSVTLDGKGAGSGTLSLDANIRKDGTTTLLPIRDIPIQLQLVREEEETTKGRRLYELKETGLEGRVKEGGERRFLVIPLKKGMPCSLVFADKDGRFQDVLMLE